MTFVLVAILLLRGLAFGRINFFKRTQFCTFEGALASTVLKRQSILLAIIGSGLLCLKYQNVRSTTPFEVLEAEYRECKTREY